MISGFGASPFSLPPEILEFAKSAAPVGVASSAARIFSLMSSLLALSRFA